MDSSVVVKVDLQDKLRRVASGKVRDLFSIDDSTLLFVATDRISAFDVVMDNVSIWNAQSQASLKHARTIGQELKIHVGN